MNQSWKMAVTATLHCLTGCAVGEVIGMVIGSAFGLHGGISIVLSITLAFLFGYTFSMFPLLRGGIALKRALKLALAADTVSISSMEIVDNLFIALIPGALGAGLATWLFWGSLGCSLLVAFIVTVPVNYWLISRGKGHAVMHDQHSHH